MNISLTKKLLPVLCLVAIVWLATGGVAQAAIWDGLITGIVIDPVLKVIAYIAYTMFVMAGWFLALCATLLNVGIQLTTHLGAFIHGNAIIYTVWSTIRDVSSMLLIFFILWAAIQMILGLQQAQYKQLITSIVVAGILLNFSFFFASVAIDASNIVSLQFYNAISPNQKSTYTPNDSIGTIISKSISDGSGGMSGIFASALRVNQWWGNKEEFKAEGETNTLIQIIISNYTGALVQVLAGLSFLAAAIAAIWRTVILIFLLGFSAIWIAAYAIPKKLDEFKNQWMGHFQANLIFLPVYLAFMYVAVLIISKSGISEMASGYKITSGNPTSAYLELFIAFAFVIFFLNIPLIAALKVSGLSLKWVDKLKGSMNGLQKWATVGRLQAGGAWAGREVAGRAASAVSRSEGLKNWAGKSFVGEMALKGIRKTGVGYDKKLETQVKARTEFAESLGYDQAAVGRWESRVRSLKQQLNTMPDNEENRDARADLKRDLEDTERIISEQKTNRKEEYMRRIDKPMVDTLWRKVARKNKKAAAKIQVDIYDTQLKDLKDDLKDIRSDVKQLQGAIRNNPPMEGRAAGEPTPAQQTELNRLTAKQTSLQGRVDTMENNLALEKLDASR